MLRGCLHCMPRCEQRARVRTRQQPKHLTQHGNARMPLLTPAWRPSSNPPHGPAVRLTKLNITWGMLNDGSKVTTYRQAGINKTATVPTNGFDLERMLRLARNYFANFRCGRALYGTNAAVGKDERALIEDQIDCVIKKRFNQYRSGEAYVC